VRWPPRRIVDHKDVSLVKPEHPQQNQQMESVAEYNRMKLGVRISLHPELEASSLRQSALKIESL